MAGVGIKVDVKVIKDVDPSLAKKVGHAVAAALALNVEAEGKRNAPKKTGNLQRSIRTDLKPTKSEGAVIAGGTKGLSSPVVYAAIQEWGGTIKPKKGKYLRFEVQNASTHALSGRRRAGAGPAQYVFAKQVTIKGKHYMARAGRTVQGRAVVIAAAIVKKMTK